MSLHTTLWLERSMEDRSVQVNFLAQDPMFDALHADPRFASLVARIGIYRRVLPGAQANPGAARSSGG